MPAIDALILDLGNVLVFHDNALLFRCLGERAGLEAAEVKSRLLDDPMWTAANRGVLDEAQLRAVVAQTLGVALGPTEFAALWSCHFTPNAPMDPLVRGLRGKVKRLVLSNTNPAHLAWLRPRTPILSELEATLFSCELGLVKPERAIFEQALKVAGTAPERTAFFDDAPEFVEAARAVGLQARVFTTVEQFRADLASFGL